MVGVAWLMWLSLTDAGNLSTVIWAFFRINIFVVGPNLRFDHIAIERTFCCAVFVVHAAGNENQQHGKNQAGHVGTGHFRLPVFDWAMCSLTTDSGPKMAMR